MVTPQSVQRARMSKFKKNGGLDQYDPERFGSLILQQSEICGTERVKYHFDPVLSSQKVTKVSSVSALIRQRDACMSDIADVE